jgi:hypothetical protein
LGKEIGTLWAKIATHFDDRTENDVKNRFYSTLRRVARKNGGSSQRILCSKEKLIKFIDIALLTGHECYSKRGRKKKEKEEEDKKGEDNCKACDISLQEEEKKIKKTAQLSRKRKTLEKVSKINCEYFDELIQKLEQTSPRKCKFGIKKMRKLTKLQQEIALLLKRSNELLDSKFSHKDEKAT